MTDIATTPAQYAAWQTNATLNQLDKDTTAVLAGVAAGDLTYPQAAVWFRLLIESAADELVRLDTTFAKRGTPA